MDTVELTLVIPAYNEEHRISKTLEWYYGVLDTHLQSWELLVVTNGCRDRTVEVIQQCAQTMPKIKSLDLGDERGKGLAIKRGFGLGKGKVVGFADADGATAAEDLIKLYQHVATTNEVAIASRWLRASNITTPQSLLRRVASRVFNLEARILFGLPIADTQCGAKFIPQSAVPVVTEKVNSSGFAFDVEMLWRLKQAGFAIKEIPVTWHDEQGSTVHVGSDGMKMALELVKLRWSKSD